MSWKSYKYSVSLELRQAARITHECDRQKKTQSQIIRDAIDVYIKCLDYNQKKKQEKKEEQN